MAIAATSVRESFARQPGPAARRSSAMRPHPGKCGIRCPKTRNRCWFFPRGVSIGFPKSAAPFRIPDIKIEVVDEGHLAAPVHMWVASLLLSFSWPRSPNRCLLLRDPDQYHAVFAFLRRRFQIRASHFLLILALLEMYD